MKNFLVALLIAVCCAAPAVGEVPTGDHISHVAEDGSYRDNARGVWVDACGDEHPLCPVCEPCEDCPEPVECEEQEPCDSTVILSCPSTGLTQDEITAIAEATALRFPEIDNRPEALKNFAVAPVFGQNEFRGIQARYKFLGIRAGRMDMSEAISVHSPGDPLDQFNDTNSDEELFSKGWYGDDEGNDEDGDECDKTWGQQDDECEEQECTVVCKHNNTVCLTGRALYMALQYGATEGECEEVPECGNQIAEAGETCNTCPEDLGECPEPICEGEECFEDLGWAKTDDKAETIEAFVYIDTFFKGDQNDCRREDGSVKALCRLGLYVGGGLVRYEEERLSVNTLNGEVRSIDSRHQLQPTATAGVDYTFPFRLTIGAGWHSEAGAVGHVGYGVVW